MVKWHTIRYSNFRVRASRTLQGAIRSSRTSLRDWTTLPGDPNRATIFVGARGTGKTVLLTAVAERAEMRGWVSVNVTDRYGMLSEIIVQLRQKASHLLTPETYSWLSEIHVHGVGFTRTKEEAPSTWRADMTKAIGRTQ